MKNRKCTCGAEAHVRRVVRCGSEGRDEVVVLVSCPVCGQTGPAILVTGGDEAAASVSAWQAWNAMIARLRPLET